jgi:GTP-binding protein
VVYASGLNGIAGNTPTDMAADMAPLFDAIMEAIDAPNVDSVEPDALQALVANIDFDNFKGKMGIARITNGVIRKGQAVALVHPEKPTRTGRVVSFEVINSVLTCCFFLPSIP